MPATLADCSARRICTEGMSAELGVAVGGGSSGSCEMSERSVCRGRSGSQESSQGVLGSKAPLLE